MNAGQLAGQIAAVLFAIGACVGVLRQQAPGQQAVGQQALRQGAKR